MGFTSSLRANSRRGGTVRGDPGEYEYCASETLLSADHIEDYRWTLYRAPYDIDDTPAIRALLNLKLPPTFYNDELIQESSPPNNEKVTISYDSPGRYVIELEVEDEAGNIGRTRQNVIIGSEPDAEITIQENENRGPTLSAAESSDADSDFSQLTFD